MSDLKLTRKLKASPEKVFAFVTQTEHLTKWWGPEKMHVPLHDLDLSRTGPWFSVMENEEGQQYKVSGEVTELDPPRSVSFTWGWHDDADRRGHESTVRFTVEPDGDGAIFTLHHFDLPDDESANNHQDGWASTLRKFDTVFN